MSSYLVILNRTCGTGHSPLDGKSRYTHVISAGANYRSYKPELLCLHIDVHARSQERGIERWWGGGETAMHIQRTPWAPGTRLSVSFFALGDNNQRNKPTYDQQGCTSRGTRKRTTCLLNIHEIVRPYTCVCTW